MITSNLTKKYNQNIIISKLFNHYRTYLYRTNQKEYFANNNFKFLYVITGNASLEFEDNNSVLLDKDELCFIGPNICYNITNNDPDSTILVLEINDKFLNKDIFEKFKNKYCSNFKIKESQNISHLMGSLYLLAFSKYWDSTKTHSLINSIISMLD